MPNPQVNKYIEEIARLLPYKKEKQQPILDALCEEVMEAMKDSEEADPIVVYGAPREVAKNVSLSQDWDNIASFSRRAMAYILDLILFTILASPLFLLLGLIYLSLLLPEPIIPILFDLLEYAQTSPQAFWLILTSIFGFVIWVITLGILFAPLYFIIIEGLISKTLGKKILGLVTCDDSGIKITRKQSLIRNLSKASPLLLILDVFIGKLAKPEKQQRLLDVIAETKIIKI
ncbi:MAG: RDD family protein [Candidatus Hodarchaeota archaeon]